MASMQSLTFGQLLKHLRQAAHLTQEALAARAGLGVRSISDLERGVRQTPYAHTLQALAEALHLAPAERALLAAAARRQPAADSLLAPDAAGTDRLSTGRFPPLVGRARELGLLDHHLSGAGPGGVLLLAGEPGIGKTRLLQEAAARARSGGWRVLEGGCQRRSGQQPYAPLVGALARYLTQQAEGAIRRDLQGCSWLVRLLPELVERALVPVPSWTLPAEQERRLLFAAVERFLANVAGPMGTVLVLDDLHWAGSDALDLLESVVRGEAERPLRVVGAFRDTEVAPASPLAQLLADLARDGRAERVEVGALAPAEAAVLAERLLAERACADATPSAAPGTPPVSLAHLLALTGGVPYYIESCARSPGAAASREVPWDVAQSIHLRVAELPAMAQELVGAAAVVGRVVPEALLVALAEQPEPAVLAALKIAHHAKLLVETEGDTYTFAHDLVREAVEAELSAGQRKALHRRVAKALERAAPTEHAAELADHFTKGGLPARALPYALRAGDQAEASSAHSEAAQHYQIAVELARAVGATPREGEAFEKLGAVLETLARYDQALEALEAGVQAYGRAGNRDELVRCTARIGLVHRSRGTLAEGLARLQPLVESPSVGSPSVGSPLAGGTAPQSLGELYLAQTELCQAIGHHDGQLAAAERAADQARLAGDTSLLARAEERRAVALLHLGRNREGVQVLKQVLPLLEQAGDLYHLTLAFNNLAYGTEVLGQTPLIEGYRDRAVAVAEQLGDLVLLGYVVHHRGLAAFITGDWERAGADLDRSVALINQSGLSSYFAGPVLFGRGWLALARGEQELAERSLAAAHAWTEAREDAFHTHEVRWAVEQVLVERDLLEGRPDRALARLEPLAEAQRRAPTPRWPHLAWAQLAWVQAALGQMAAAEATLAWTSTLAAQQEDTLALVEVRRIQALVALLQQQWEAAERALCDSLAWSRAIGLPYAEAKALQSFGHLLAAQGKLQAACERFEAALVILHRLGERLYAEHIEQALADLGSSVPRS